jgi:hypothetical protein
LRSARALLRSDCPISTPALLQQKLSGHGFWRLIYSEMNNGPADHSAAAANSAIKKFEESQLPVYSIKEMKAGPLHHYVWLHGKLVPTGSWVQTLAQLRKMAMSPPSVLGQHRGRSPGGRSAQRPRRNPSRFGEEARQQSKNRRCNLRPLSFLIALHNYACLATAANVTSSVVQELECYSEPDFSEEHGLIVVGETKCQPRDGCPLAVALKKDLESLKKLKAVVEAQPEKPENARRAKALKELIRVPKNKVTEQPCRHLGDAVFAFFCPQDATILSTNTRDLRPLAESLGKKAQSPDEIT